MSGFAQAYGLYVDAAAAAARPRRRLTVAQHADATRRLTAKGSSRSGPWRTSLVPYLREPMEVLSSRSPVKRVVMMFPTQMGKTEVGLNWINYVIDHDPAPMLVVVPTLEVRKRWSVQRLVPMLRENEALVAKIRSRATRDASNTEDIKDFPGGLLILSGANSPASLASMPIKYVLCDEVDRFPWEVGTEGDPLGLIEERTSTFPGRKMGLLSTPTVTDASRIEDEWENSDQRRYHVPCPHCDDALVLKWGNLKWDRDVHRAWYVCEHCGSTIDEHHKTRMLAPGEWRPGNPGHLTRGYHLNKLYAPIGMGFKWIELVRKWLDAQKDKAKLKRFINTTLAESWRDVSRDIKSQTLADRGEAWHVRQVPPGCLLLTAGVDTQDDRLALQILGWGRRETCYIIDWVEIPGDPGRDEVWTKLTDLLNRPIANAYGKELLIQATAIDTGGHHTHDVYAYVRSRKARRLMAIKGSSLASKPVLSARPSEVDINWRGKVIPRGVRLWTVGTDTAKHLLSTRLLGDADLAPEERKIRFPGDLPLDYYDQITAETYDPERNRWVCRRGRRNEGTDTWVYGTAAAHHPELRVHAMRLADWERLARVLEPDAPPDDGPDTAPEDPAAQVAREVVEARRSRKRRGQRKGNFVNGWKE